MTIREELEILGPERVRRGMAAFDCRTRSEVGEDNHTCAVGDFAPCCFLTHAWGYDPVHVSLFGARQFLGFPAITSGTRRGPPATEAAFENWFERANTTRAELHAECVAYLAEHGTAPEVAPVSLETVGQA